MTRVCAYCQPGGRFMGFKEPYENKEETHGICNPCLSLFMAGFKFEYDPKHWATWVREER